tara:strand:- start:16 stop:225 length:210 start_codon:yes stop_codon:yes gene_type:complete
MSELAKELGKLAALLEVENTAAAITLENLDAFRAAYESCKGEVFIFEGQEVLKAYAKYLLMFFDASTLE